MSTLYPCLRFAATALAIMLSPAIVVFAVPFAWGIGSDLVASAWLPPGALAAAAAVMINAARRTRRAQSAAGSSATGRARSAGAVPS